MASLKSNQIKINLISQSFIKPKYQVEASMHPHYLGPIDLAMLSLDHMQTGLLFNSKPTELNTFLDILKHSLSLSLVHFYPLAGHLVTQKFHDEHTSWIYLDCNKGPGARILHAAPSVDLTVFDILSSTDVHPVVQRLFDLGEKAVNHDGHIRPLLSIQVTEILDGIFIGFTMNHSAGDGTSFWHFINTLSSIFLQLHDNDTENKDYDLVLKSILSKPIYGPIFPKGYGPILRLPYLEPNEFVVRYDPGQLRERIFHFLSKSVAKLKVMANHECVNNGDHDGKDQNISSFQALCALLWRAVTRARNLEPEENTFCSLATNTRSKLDPPVSPDHFGNFIASAQAKSTTGQLLGQGLGRAALMVHQAVVCQDPNGVRNFLNSYVKAPFVGHNGPGAALYKPNDLVVAGSSKFDKYGPEFGLGRAVASLTGYSNKVDGKVTASPGREGGGSVDLEVTLNPQTMNALELDEEFMSFVSPI